MGSLPNLHELTEAETTQQWPVNVMRGLQWPAAPMRGLALGHLCGGGGGGEILTAEERHRILHRYSGHGRLASKVKQWQSGQERNVYDEATIEHMATYSPISARSAHMATHHSIRRRDSINSSIGATSVRRLLSSVINAKGPLTLTSGHNSNQPVYTRRALIRNLLLLCFVNMMVTAAWLPYLALQGSVSVWVVPPVPLSEDTEPSFRVNINIGSLVLGMVYGVGCISALIGPALVQHLGPLSTLLFCLLLHLLHYASLLYPHLSLLIPMALLAGLGAGPLHAALMAHLMGVAMRLAGPGDEGEARRRCTVRRAARAVRGGGDIGLMIGSILSAVVIGWVGAGQEVQWWAGGNGTGEWMEIGNLTLNSTLYPLPDPDSLFDTLDGQRLCGSQACPSFTPLLSNATGVPEYLHLLPSLTASMLAAVYGAMAACALVAAAALPGGRGDRWRITAWRGIGDAFKDARVGMIGVMGVWIGMEQAFFYADFSKSYVVCTLGAHRLNLVFLSMGLLQSIAACTLSMLLRSIRRYYVVAVGFAFHACLIMVLILWKPIEDDPALFYVISASWGVCNAIWEMLTFTLLTGQYTEAYEAPFAVMTSYQYFGLAVGFTLHGFLCNYAKLYLLACMLVAAAVPFAWLEYRLESLRRGKHCTKL